MKKRRRKKGRSRRVAAAVVVVKAKRSQRLKARARQIVERVAAPVVRRVAASRPVRFVTRSRSMAKIGGMDLKSVVRDTVMNGAGGMAGAVVSAGLKLSDATKEYGPASHALLQFVGGVGLKYFFGGSRSVSSFVAGANGQAAGDALDSYGLQAAVKAIKALNK